MRGSSGTGARLRAIAGAAALTAAVGMLLAGGAFGTEAGVSAKQGNKTYGLVTKTNLKKGKQKLVAVKKPDALKYSSFFDFYKASKLKKFKGWGSEEVSAEARSVRLCELEGSKKTNCTKAAGSVTFDTPIKRKCKKGGKKKKVYLYGRTIFDQGPTKEYPDGRGAGVQYSVGGSKPDCPKF